MTKIPDPGWTLLDHTADIRMEIRGHTLLQLFENAALGLVDVLLSGASVAPEKRAELTLREETAEELLVSLLRELLYKFQTEGLIVADIEILEATEQMLKAKLAYGIPREDFQPEVEIKGVTYHGLKVETHDWGYSARVVFDI